MRVPRLFIGGACVLLGLVLLTTWWLWPWISGTTPNQLISAAVLGDVQALNDAAEHGADFDVRMRLPHNSGETTPLAAAAVSGNLHAVEALLNAGASIDYPDDKGNTPLFYAIAAGHEGVALMLIQHGADPNRPSPEGITPLFLAAMYGLVDTFDALVEAGADPRQMGPRERTVLHEAAFSGNPELVKRAIDFDLDVNAAVWFRGTPLHAASGQGHVEAVRLLLDAGADPSISFERRGTPLNYVTELIHKREQHGDYDGRLAAFREITAILNSRSSPATQAAPPTTAPAR